MCAFYYKLIFWHMNVKYIALAIECVTQVTSDPESAGSAEL